MPITFTAIKSLMCVLLFSFQLVYGIREAKGLEFKTVIILDFFREIPSSLQKPWRELVLDRASQEFERSHPLAGTMLKLLYTGVTRCIEKLFFVETKSSTAGDATTRWLTKKSFDKLRLQRGITSMMSRQ